MKTVPTVRLADTADAVVLPDLPEEIRLAMTDIAGAAREGLLAMSVAAGMAVMPAMFEAEIAEACRAEGQARPRTGPRCAMAAGRGSVTLGGRRVAVGRPRARTLDGHEVPLTSYAHFAADDMLTAGGDGADAGRGGHPPTRPHRRAGRRPGRPGGEID